MSGGALAPDKTRPPSRSAGASTHGPMGVWWSNHNKRAAQHPASALPDGVPHRVELHPPPPAPAFPSIFFGRKRQQHGQRCGQHFHADEQVLQVLARPRAGQAARRDGDRDRQPLPERGKHHRLDGHKLEHRLERGQQVASAHVEEQQEKQGRRVRRVVQQRDPEVPAAGGGGGRGWTGELEVGGGCEGGLGAGGARHTPGPTPEPPSPSSCPLFGAQSPTTNFPLACRTMVSAASTGLSSTNCSVPRLQARTKRPLTGMGGRQHVQCPTEGASTYPDIAISTRPGPPT